MKRKTTLKTGIIFFILSLIAFSANAQTFPERLSNNLTVYNTAKTPEKIYLHIDKTLYQQDDNIFYKVYLANGITNKLNPVSNMVYIELIDPKGSVIEKKTLSINKGVANGYFTIGQSFKGGMYKIKAYTNWMKNFANDDFFEKELIIQKVVMPNVLLKVDFDKEAYGPGSKVVADLSIKNLKNEAISDYPVTAKILINNKLIDEQTLTTDSEGKLDVKFKLPENLNTNDGLLNIQIKYNEQNESISRSIPIVLNNIDLAFFPEGGYIVANAENKIAFEALNEFGLPADIEGVILDENNKIVADFQSFHQGMGAFSFTPQKNVQYKAQITKPHKLDTVFLLPKSLNSGFVLSYLNTKNKKVNLNIYSTNKEITFLVATIRDSLKYIERVDLKAGNNKISIPCNNFSDGIVRITLFNAAGTPECERLIYYGEISPMNVEIKLKKDKFAKDELTDIEIITTSNNKPVSANLSLAIIDDKNITFADDKQDNILSWFLMSSEVKGKIYEPSFYFDKEEEKAEKALDFVLMTHGWRRFTWKEILNEQPIVKFQAETNRTIAGQVLKTNQKGIKAEVWLFELNNQQRAAQLTTTDDGYFIFTNVDPTSNIQLVAKSNRLSPKSFYIREISTNELPDDALLNVNFADNVQIITSHKIQGDYNENTKPNSTNSNNETLDQQVDPNKLEVVDLAKNNSETKIAEQLIISNDNPDLIDNFDDEMQGENISEVVITGLGIKKDAKSLGYAVQDISGERLSSLNALSGKVSGVNISNASGSVGSSTNIVMRGYSSFNTNSPLYIVDGVPISYVTDINDPILERVNPSNISSVYIIEGPEATAFYGNRAANGVIIINTNSSTYGNSYIYKKNRYQKLYLNSLFTISNNNTNQVETYNTKEYWRQQNETRDRNATVYWNANVQTDENGKAIVSIYCPDEVSTFKIITEGISGNGDIGRSEQNLSIIKPVNIQTKVPYELSYNDTMSVPVVINNSTQTDITGKIVIQHSKNLMAISVTEIEVTVKANSSLKELFSFRALPVAGEENIKIHFVSENHVEELNYNLTIYPKGFPVKESFSSSSKSISFTFDINQPVENSFDGSFNIYANVLDDITAGVEGMFRQPGGCFEQTSMSTYPNILALSLLKETGQSKPDIEKKALDYIDQGYKRLITFETSENGFEWFGHTPAHEGLTAMGIMEFTEMQNVYQGVDGNMLKRTKEWLLSRKDGKGNFAFSTNSYHSWLANQSVVNAYVLYALSKCGMFDMEKEFLLAKEEALKSKDPYRLGLMANTAFYLNKQNIANELVDEITELLDKKDFNSISIEPSITNSTGISLKVETASLYLLALLKQDIKNSEQIQKTILFIQQNRTFGNFGSTQATVLALSALTEYSKLYKKTKEDITLRIVINGKTIDKKIAFEDLNSFSIDMKEYITGKGKQNIEISFVSNDDIPYSFDFEWNSLKFTPSENCKVDLITNLESETVKVGDNVRMNIIIENKSTKGIPMTTAEIGIPAGLSLQPWQLKELSEKNSWDYYEIFDGKLVIYYVGMEPNEQRHLKLDLKADIAGNYTSRASSCYLYYTNEFKDWEAGTHIKILED
ncbi:MAG: TonB-dependent receptor plug domain-containing protein [Bacteroidales bacterium]|nr:TonB-dependent receptor plug domain-containing protein [Bacteroidales bacterium]